MSEKENEREEKEREMVDHWNHEHPLAPVDIQRSIRVCDGCLKPFGRGEKGYGCSRECGYDVLLHEECAEAPRKIRHAMHPQHTLTQQYSPVEWQTLCSVCQWYVARISYRCTGAECMFVMHISCAQGSDMMYGAKDGEGSIIHHPSHPKHELKLLRRKCSFKCDACGTTHSIGSSSSSYTCTDDACEYWIHERCASLPHTIQREDHNHSLSLSFHVPLQYLEYNYRCDACGKRLISKYWIYHCELCSYAVHIACAFNKSLPHSREQGIMKFPISDVGEDLIRAFVRRQGGDTHTHMHTPIPHHDVAYKFHNHKLTLVASASYHEENEEEEDDDDEEDYSCRREKEERVFNLQREKREIFSNNERLNESPLT